MPLRKDATPDRADHIDLDRLAGALHGYKQCEFGYCDGPSDHQDEAEGIRREYESIAALATPDRADPEPISDSLLEDEDGAPFPDEVQRAFRIRLGLPT